MTSAKYKVDHAGCPIAFAAETFGDKWTLLVLREVLLFGKKHFDELAKMREGIATNILSSRLEQMIARGLLTKEGDPGNRRRFVYAPTEKALDLLPACAELILWASKYDPATAVSGEQIAAFRRNKKKAMRDLRSSFARDQKRG